MKRLDMVMDVRDVPKKGQWFILSLQHLFAMFGATVLVPFLTGISPAVALISSGTGTLAYLLITKGRIPVYLGSSFAFIAPLIYAIGDYGIPGAMVGSFFAGVVFGLIVLLFFIFWTNWLMKMFLQFAVGLFILVH